MRNCASGCNCGRKPFIVSQPLSHSWAIVLHLVPVGLRDSEAPAFSQSQPLQPSLMIESRLIPQGDSVVFLSFAQATIAACLREQRLAQRGAGFYERALPYVVDLRMKII